MVCFDKTQKVFRSLGCLAALTALSQFFITFYNLLILKKIVIAIIINLITEIGTYANSVWMQNLRHGDWIEFENPGIVNMAFSVSSLDFCVAKTVLEAKSQLADEKIIALYILHLKYCHKRVSLQSDAHSSYCFQPFRLFKSAGLLHRACVHLLESGKFKDCIKTGKMWLFPSVPCADANQPYPEGGCTLLLMG